MAKSINYGEYAFLGGLAIALLLGILSSVVPATIMPLLMVLLFLFGIIVGLVNITEKEVNTFLIATIALLLAATSWSVALGRTLEMLGQDGGMFGQAVVMLAGMFDRFSGAVIAFISPAAFIVAIKSVYKLAQPD